MRSIAALIFTLCLSIAVFAQQNEENLEDLLELSLEDLLNIPITTATKTSGKLDVAPSVIDVITGDQIKQRGYQNLGQLLNDIGNNHQDRTNWGIGEPIHQNVGFGFRFDTGQNILILFNGQRLNAFLPGNRFGGEEYLLNTIDQVEIIRGPGSALYGTGAFTAVVNIISKKNNGNGDHFEVNAEYIPTSHGVSIGASMNTQLKEGTLLTAGFRRFTESGQQLEVNNSLFGNRKIKDGVDHTIDGEIFISNKNLNFYTKLTNQQRNTFTGFNGVNPDTEENLSLSMYGYSAGLDYTIKTGNKSNIKYSVGWHQDNWTEVAWIPQFKLNDDGTALLLDDNNNPILDTVTIFRGGDWIETSFFADGQGADTRSLDSELQFTLNYRKSNHIVVGLYLADDRIIDAVRPTELNINPFMFIPFSTLKDPSNNWLFDVNASRQTWATFAQVDYSITNDLHLNAGIRLDNYSGKGVLKNQKYEEVNPRAALVYNKEQLGTFKFLFGTATRIPNGFETLSAVSILGNSNNRPERIRTLQWQWINNWSNNWRTEVGFFHSQISNRLETNANIDDVLRAQGFVGQFVNVNGGIRQKNQGVDFKVIGRIKSNSTISLNMTQYFGSDDGRGNTIAYIPTTMVNADYTFVSEVITFNFGINYRGEFTKASEDDRDPVKAYTIARSTINYHPQDLPFEFKLTTRNLFNTKYNYPSSSQDFINHFPARGFELSLGVILKML